MNKTIFNLDYKISVIIVSLIGIIFGFLSNVYYVSGVMDFVLYIFRFALFIGVFVIFSIVEKKNVEFSDTNKRMVGYLLIASLFNLVFSLFVATHLLSGLFITLSGIVCLWLILSFLIEILSLFIENKIIRVIYEINKKIGLMIANPIVKIFTND